ncbi:hypothetical protein NL108_011328 [Boleophthalmus pectinirostris]|nr:hypothetical protein NL108_011328 [Boleophthalmus pectinirostris]
MRRLPVRFLLCACIWELCFGTEPPRALEVDVLNLNKESKWTSNPASEFNKITMPRGTGLMLQACGSPHTRSALSAWTERGDAAHLYLDITFALSASGEPVPLKIHLLDSSFPSTQISARWSVLELNVSRRFPAIIDPKKLSPFFLTRKALSLGPVRRTGFQLGLSYRGACVLVSSIRVFYKKCPDSVLALSSFSAATGGSGPVRGSCVQGAVEGEGPPERNCSVEGVWGPQQGQCVCGPGHQPMSDHCQACDIGFYKWANQSGGCQKCPLHSHTLKVGSDSCECVPGFSRLPSHPYDLGCAKPPSAPLNVTAHHYNDSMLVLMWDPPLDRGGRLNVSYHVRCETRGQHGSQWKTCDGVLFLLDSLTTTSVNLSGINAYQDYKLSVEAWNDISSLQGAPLSSTATVTIQRWRAPPVVTPVNAPRTKVQVQEKRNLFLWVFLGVMFGVLLLLAVIPITVCIFQRKYSELRPEQDVELTPLNPRISYRRPEQASVLDVCMRPETAQDESVLGLLEGLGERLATSLKEVLVERRLLNFGQGTRQRRVWVSLRGSLYSRGKCEHESCSENHESWIS